MKSIIAFVLGATIVGVSSGVIASDVETYNEENGLWSNPCPVVYGVDRYAPCDEDVAIYMEENMLYDS
jgi:hypothetical protein